MRRKVIQLANSTFVVTLPSTWVKEWGITKGKELYMQEQGPRIIMSTDHTKETKRCSVECENATERALRWVLSSLHKKGYDEIEMKIDPKHRGVLDEVLRDLFLGFTIIQSKGASHTIQAVSREFDNQFENVLRRAFLVTLEMGDVMAQVMESKNNELMSHVLALEKSNNQLTNFCQRILNKRGHEMSEKTTFYYVVIWNLEKIADSYKYIVQELAKGAQAGNDTKELLAKANRLLRSYYELFYAFKTEKLVALAEEFQKLRGVIEADLQKDSVIRSHIHHIVMKTADFSSSTFAIHN